MPKIRDLGINVIPVTMRPPEIGLGGFDMAAGPAADGPGTCVQETDCDLETCDPSGQCVPSCDEASKAPRHARGFSPDAVAELKQQMQQHLEN